MGVFIGKSTPIYNRMTDEIIVGKIPAGSVVISGSLPADNGKYARSAAIIVKQVDEKTRSKTSINELLRC
ncbi:MAG: 2,3,4,5-tetrahydropyridine-2,6-carboxylate N-succinyltransferase [uncultured bacterium]|nr:MAG: 2,3,4,5-tetrahydropyridine-2,6-carboxylate N-succinyltransferase [uncultured bacterium]